MDYKPGDPVTFTAPPGSRFSGQRVNGVIVDGVVENGRIHVLMPWVGDPSVAPVVYNVPVSTISPRV